MIQRSPRSARGSDASAAARPAARAAVVWTALCGVLGTVTLIGSFFINPGPPPGAAVDQLLDFGRQHYDTILLGGWLQGIGSLLTVLFALALVHLAGATHRFAGWATLLAGAAILLVSLVEVTFYLAAAQAAVAGDPETALLSDALIRAVQHAFLIAPALLLPLGAVLLDSRLLPRGFAYLALALGGVLQVLGLVGLFAPLQPVIDVILVVQGLWFLGAALTLLVGASPSRSVRVGHIDVGEVADAHDHARGALRDAGVHGRPGAPDPGAG
jgi:hypothetical protein